MLPPDIPVTAPSIPPSDGCHRTNQESPDEGRGEVAARVAYCGVARLFLGQQNARCLLVHVADRTKLVRVDLGVAVDAEEALGLGSERQAVVRVLGFANCSAVDKLAVAGAALARRLVRVRCALSVGR